VPKIDLTMGKRPAIFLLVLLIAAIAVMGYFFSQSRKTLFTDPYKAVNTGACIVIETVDLRSFLNSLTSGQGLFGEIGGIKELAGFNRNLKYLADQLNKQEFKTLSGEGKAVISFHADSRHKLKPLFSVTVPGTFKKRHVRELLFTAGAKEVIEGRAGTNTVLKIPYKVNNLNDTVFVALLSGLMLGSTSEELIREAVGTTGSGIDVRSLDGFSRVFLASGKKEDKVFIVFRNLTRVLDPLFSNKDKRIPDKITKLAAVAEGDIYISEGGVVFSGYTESLGSDDILNRFKTVEPREFNTYKILPSSTVLFETTIRPGKTMISGTGDIAGFSNNLKSYLGHEISRVYLDLRGRPIRDNSLVIYELADRSLVEQLLLKEPGSARATLYFAPDEATKHPVYNIQLSGLIEAVLPGFAPGMEETFVTFYDNFMITGSSYVSVSRMLYDNMLNKTLANDLLYRDFESSLPSRSGYFFYCVPSRILEYLSGFLNEDIMVALKANRNFLSKIQAAGYQLSSSNDMIYNSLSVSFKEMEREESTTEWETLLDTLAAIKPFFFTNHITGAKEIFIQDLKNNSYLVNAAGRVLWKVPLRERITGSVYMIDYYRNGKFQLLFSGKNHIHILDRNGNYVERYPVRLRSPSTNSLALFDYDNNRNYRLFISGEDKLIYSYDITGSAVKGWKPFRTSGNVSSELSWFRVSGKDYLVAADESSLYFLDRTGNRRLNIREPVTRAKGSAMRLNAGSEPFVVCSSPDGTIQQIYFDGSVKKFSLKSFSVDHSFDFFDVDGDGFGEYIFIDKGRLYLYNNDRSEIFTRDFESDATGGPISFIFSSSDRKIGVFDSNKKLIYLIEKNGETAKGFPLRGASMFSIGRLSDKSGWHLIVGGTDRFLYNYKLETD
jgi:WD40 repeat protein